MQDKINKVNSSKQFHKQFFLKANTLFRTIVEKSNDVVCLLDLKGEILYVSPPVTRVLGHDPEFSSSRNAFEYVHPADLEYIQTEFNNFIIEDRKVLMVEARVQHSNGSWRWVEGVCTNLLSDPEISAIVVNFRDISERKNAVEKSKYQYYHDSLTDLPNRNYFTQKVTEMIESRGDQVLGVVIIDLDRFKLINESLGHAIGDRLIQEVGLRLATCLENGDFLARLGGDEFGLILSNIEKPENIGFICRKILACFKPAFIFENHSLFISPSLGISVYPQDGRDVCDLLKNTDSALYRAKELGRNNFQYYNKSMNALTFQKLAMENTLRSALDRKEFIVYYQPQIDVKTGKIVQVEALTRWMHPEFGLTFPEQFISIAETTGLIQPIGDWVFRQACLDVKKWQGMGFDLDLAVNLSTQQLRQKHITRLIRKALADTGFDPNKLELELTESILMEESPAFYSTMVQLKKDGVRFALDDFNTGYSSLNYIKRFPIDILKIDKSFVKGLPLNEKDSAIANAIINLSHSLGMQVVAEGVERIEQLKFLQFRNCDKAQGYLFSPAVTADELLGLLERNVVYAV